ncbi:MAG: hypothetical protein ACRDXB_16420 [Actinomycetes bacterium]
MAELRAEMARQRVTAASLARRLEPGDEDAARKLARRLRRQLSGERDLRMSEFLAIGRALGLQLTVTITEREDT